MLTLVAVTLVVWHWHRAVARPSRIAGAQGKEPPSAEPSVTRPRILKAWGVCVAFGYCAAILSLADRGSLIYRGFVLAMAAGSLPGTADPWAL
jgi:hypothetical protein